MSYILIYTSMCRLRSVGFLVHKSLISNVVEVNSLSTRVAYLELKLTDRHYPKVVQVYAPTSSSRGLS